MKTQPKIIDAAIIRRILLDEWDPIGIRNYPEAADEYDAYTGFIREQLNSRVPLQTLIDHLWQIETAHIGLNGDRKHTEQIAKRLMELIAD